MPAFIHSDRGPSFKSTNIKHFLYSTGIATSRTTPYNPEGKAQCERYNGIIWKAITLALKNHKLLTTHWKAMIPYDLHPIRTLILFSTSCTPHGRLCQYQRRSAPGCNVPSWLSTPGQVLLKKHVRKSKYDPLIELTEANPQYAHIEYPNGKETTVSARHLAPKRDDYKELNSEQNDTQEQYFTEANSTHPDAYEDSSETINADDDILNENEQIVTETAPNSNESDIKPVCPVVFIYIIYILTCVFRCKK